eukprot:5599550-Prymnesium_polylepis.1
MDVDMGRPLLKWAKTARLPPPASATSRSGAAPQLMTTRITIVNMRDALRHARPNCEDQTRAHRHTAPRDQRTETRRYAHAHTNVRSAHTSRSSAGRAEERCPVLDVLDVDDGVVSSRWEDVPHVEGFAILAWKVLIRNTQREHTPLTHETQKCFRSGRGM